MIGFLKSINIEIKDILLIFGGALVTIIVEHFSGIATVRREGKYRIAEKIIEKKLVAYEDLMNIAKSMRRVQIYGDEIPEYFPFQEEFAPHRYPIVFESREIFDEWLGQVVQVFDQNSEWLDNDIVREFNFFQDYIMNVSILISQMNDYENVRLLGCILRQDLIDISSNLEKLSFKFYSKKVFKVKFENKNKWHKYPRDITYNKFRNTHLEKYAKYIAVL